MGEAAQMDRLEDLVSIRECDEEYLLGGTLERHPERWVSTSMRVSWSLGCGFRRGGDVTRRGQLGCGRHSHSTKSRRVMRNKDNTDLV